MTEQYLNLLREVARTAIATDQDIAVSSNVFMALLNEVDRLRKERLEWERRARELESIAADRL